jgi:transglutaminase-like putative cysteine protease
MPVIGMRVIVRWRCRFFHLAEDGYQEDRYPIAGGNTHAWSKLYVPGPGWVDFDPSAGAVGNKSLIRVAVVHDPREAIPVQGTWYGSALDHSAMQVAVKVTEDETRNLYAILFLISGSGKIRVLATSTGKRAS